MTRTGKIARLSRDTRDALNRRLHDGQTGRRVVDWLNSLPEVRAVLKAEFRGRPISEQNLSQWKAGGYLDWLRHQESLAFARNLVEEAEALEEQSADGSLADRLSAPVTLALGRLIREVAADPDLPARDKAERLLPLAAEVGHLRRQDHERERLRLLRERWDHELEGELRKERSDDALRPLYGLMMGQSIRELYGDKVGGGKPLPPEVAAFLATATPKPLLFAANSTGGLESSLIKPDQTESNQPPSKSGPVKPGQGRSK